MQDAFKASLLELFREAYEGKTKSYTWFIDDEGLFQTLETLSAEDASSEGPSGSTIAAHAEHLRWSLALANAFARGEQPETKWSESWTVKTVAADGWDKLRENLRREYETLRAALERREDFSDPQLLTGVLALVPHAAYHLGAIRQMARAL
jgi:hypothetical protein